jgi:hypothetical protein
MLYVTALTPGVKATNPQPTSHHIITSLAFYFLRRGDGLSDASTSLSRGKVSDITLDLLRLLDNLLALGQDEFDVARVGHVRVDL